MAVAVHVPTQIRKRDGSVVEFDPERIQRAIAACFASVGHGRTDWRAEVLTDRVVNAVSAKFGASIPSVEDVQDIVEIILHAAGEFDAAKHYILYRAERTRHREERAIPDDVRAAFAASDAYFPTPIQKFQYFDKYSRFDYSQGRRETWVETVDRAVDFLYELGGDRLPRETYERIRGNILAMRSMPSMRLLAMAGAPARRNNISIYNCSYLPIDDIRAFSEAMYISMSGCGVGFSVESRNVSRLPRVQHQTGSRHALIFDDSSEGWADGLRTALEIWFSGGDVDFDLSQIRPAGTPLMTKGGRASGPEPLRAMLEFTRRRILARQGSVLRPLDAHDIMCAVGNAAVQGGVRRTAMISLFDWDDDEMRLCKSGDFERENSQRWNANNSMVLPRGGVTQTEFATAFMDMVRSERGEPGIFSREVAEAMKPERRQSAEWGTNPCAEIVLRPFELCNLSIAVARQDDDYESLRDKVDVATIIGTIQSLATHFPVLRPEWRQNCEDERLLGVDITGQLDSPIAQNAIVMQRLKQHAVNTNRVTAAVLGIHQAAAVTTVKPSGNSAQLLDCSSGLHARWSKYYIRNIRVGTHSPLFKVLRDAGAPMDPENGQHPDDASTWVVHFPVKAPHGAITRNERSAIDQCRYWLQNKLNWTEHNPSVTITYRPDEVIDILRWSWNHRDSIVGIAFLPSFDAQYDQLPYVEISQDEYERRAAEFPEIDFAKVYRYEHEDLTTAAQELACVGGACDWQL